MSIAPIPELVAELAAGRMVIWSGGPAAHSEGSWDGRVSRIGEAVVAVSGHVGLCLVATQDPNAWDVEMTDLDMHRSYRSTADTTETLAFGIYGEVLEPGTIRVGDLVAPD
mgnify:CR=1 FL=1